MVYDELKNFHGLRKTFEKGERYSLGERTEQTLLDLLSEIVRAGSERNEWKIAALDLALRHLERTKILLRLAHDMRQIPERQYLEHQERLQRIGRMLGGWRKST